MVLHELRTVVIAIRGTETPEDLIIDGLGRERSLTEVDLDGLIKLVSLSLPPPFLPFFVHACLSAGQYMWVPNLRTHIFIYAYTYGCYSYVTLTLHFLKVHVFDTWIWGYDLQGLSKYIE